MENDKKDVLWKKNILKIILEGSIISFVSLLVLMLIYATILTYTSLNENTIPVVTIIINAISILIGSSIATINVKKNGILNGIIIGMVYMLFVYLISGILNNDFSIQLQSILLIVFGIMAGGIGGIIGVNIK